jgi:hypothetical protein
VIALQIGLRELVFFFWREDEDRVAAEASSLSAARFIVVLSGSASRAGAGKRRLESLARAEKPAVPGLSLRLVGVRDARAPLRT